ncbi:hypothetical protein [Oceaniglobus trochenteri]|uniref:hypothetical protein n=1 Tax=Oceaniglobus trochenteri TaxID=2763260 RepID=UPI001D000A56|nr:hypothetical protein [Oceaniglobus trochenteri]
MKHQGAIQIVFVKWGTKYGPEYVNGLVTNIRAGTKAALDFICFTDDATDISPDVDIRPFPDFGVPVTTMTSRGGSLLKMSMFLKGQLKTGVPTLYIDLDSSVIGDVVRLVDCLEQRRGMYMLQRHAIPHWRFRGLVKAVAPDRYYLANTAVMAFYVEDWHQIAERFMVDFPRYLEDPAAMDPATRRLYDEGNERIISQATRDASRVFPNDVAIKFTQEYMSPILAIAALKDRLPHVRARRERQVIVSYQGESLKPAELVHAEQGDLILYKYYKTRWAYPELSRYWRAVLGAPGS